MVLIGRGQLGNKFAFQGLVEHRALTERDVSLVLQGLKVKLVESLNQPVFLLGVNRMLELGEQQLLAAVVLPGAFRE